MPGDTVFTHSLDTSFKDVLAASGPEGAGVFFRLHQVLLAELNAVGELDWSRACVDGSHIRAKKGAPTPVRRQSTRRKAGSKHHLICDGRGAPLKVITTAANVNDITQTLNLVDGIPPVAGRPGRPQRRPEAVLGDKAYDSKAVRLELRRRRIANTMGTMPRTPRRLGLVGLQPHLLETPEDVWIMNLRCSSRSYGSRSSWRMTQDPGPKPADAVS
ncbi:transposase [Streptomyces sp. NBC_01693]|uniref:transposase n=1 Tax=Streptomyces sp. NBC_01693 TaxID=2975912 RepID=UPI002E3442D9|nr:transposase [Streptomyces sp. NBC_01693]